MAIAQAVTLAGLRMAAMNLLARREHSAQELRNKLQQKFAQPLPPEWLEQVLSMLAGEGLQSDARFAEAFVQMRCRQGKGPMLVGQELRQRGVAAELVASTLAEPDWLLQAQLQRHKRFGIELPLDAKERARQQRFLQMRGFGGEHIRYAMSVEMV